MTRAIVVGAGGGGLAAALELANSGFDVTVLESHICGWMRRHFITKNTGSMQEPLWQEDSGKWTDGQHRKPV